MNCKKCGFQLNPDSKFCPNCGTIVSDNNSLNSILQNGGDVTSNQQVNMNYSSNGLDVNGNNNLKTGNYSINKKVVYIVIGVLLVLLLFFGVKKCSGSLSGNNGYTAGVGSTLKVKGSLAEFNIKATSSLEKTKISDGFDDEDLLKLDVLVENNTDEEQLTGGITTLYDLTDSNKNVIYKGSVSSGDNSIFLNGTVPAKQNKNLTIYFDSSESDKDFSKIDDVVYLKVTVPTNVSYNKKSDTASGDYTYYYLKLK